MPNKWLLMSTWRAKGLIFYRYFHYILHTPPSPQKIIIIIYFKKCVTCIFLKTLNLNLFHLFSILFSQIEFTEFLEVVIDRQGDSRDMYDEILKGFSMFDFGKFFLRKVQAEFCHFIYVTGLNRCAPVSQNIGSQ